MTKDIDFNDVDLGAIGKEVATTSLLKFEKGETEIRVLPPWRAGEQFYKPYRMHFGLDKLREYGLEVDGWFNEPCISERVVVEGDSVRTVSSKCPICKIANSAWMLGTRNGDAALTQLSKDIRAKNQFAANVQVVSTGEVKTMVFGKKIFEGLQTIFSKFGNITHPIKGRNISVVKKEGQDKRFADYSVLHLDPSDISDDWNNIKAAMKDLDEFPNYREAISLSERLDGVILEGTVTNTDFQAPAHTESKAESVDELDLGVSGLNLDDL